MTFTIRVATFETNEVLFIFVSMFQTMNRVVSQRSRRPISSTDGALIAPVLCCYIISYTILLLYMITYNMIMIIVSYDDI